MKKTLFAVLALILCLFAFGACGAPKVDPEQRIALVRDSMPEGYDFTIGQAFHAFFQEGSWQYIELESGTRVVDFVGYYQDQKYEFQWEPSIQGEQEEYVLYYAGTDGEPWTQIETEVNLDFVYHRASILKEAADHGGSPWF